MFPRNAKLLQSPLYRGTVSPGDAARELSWTTCPPSPELLSSRVGGLGGAHGGNTECSPSLRTQTCSLPVYLLLYFGPTGYRILVVVDLTQEALALDLFHIQSSKPSISPSVSFDSVPSNPPRSHILHPQLGSAYFDFPAR